MEEQLISLETAKLAKEKGFKEMCFAAFHKNNRNDGYFESGIISQSEYFRFPNMSNGDKIAVLQKDYIHTILRPTQSLLAKWLREEHNIHLIAYKNINIDGYDWCYITTDGITNINSYKTYEEAYEIGLQEALKLI